MKPDIRIVCLGERTYRVDTPWGKLGSIELGLVSQLAIDSKGNVYLLQRKHPSILVFAPSGDMLAAWDHVTIMDGHGISVSPDDRILVIDRDAHEIIIFDTEGRVLQKLGSRNRPRHGMPFNHPTDVAVASDGEIYVADGYGNSNVHRIAADGTHLMSWGKPGIGPGEFSTPHAVWIDPQNRVLVADRENNRVQLFNRDGAFLGAWGDLFHPMDIWGDANGWMLITDQIPRLSLLSPDGKLAGRCRPVLNGAHGVWGTPDGSIFLAEMHPSRITKLVPLAVLV
jgi:DNA-binding beta-propeller fold protein YncE